jgi:hypothetical protein
MHQVLGIREAIFEGGISQVLKKHVFTAMLAQHVASELRMRLWTLSSRTDRNTRSRFKIDLGKSGYNGFFVITDITDFSFFDRFITDEGS